MHQVGLFGRLSLTLFLLGCVGLVATSSFRPWMLIYEDFDKPCIVIFNMTRNGIQFVYIEDGQALEVSGEPPTWKTDHWNLVYARLDGSTTVNFSTGPPSFVERLKGNPKPPQPVTLPLSYLLIAIVLASLLTARLWFVAMRRRYRLGHGLCTTCGYDLRATGGDACTECGSPLPV